VLNYRNPDAHCPVRVVTSADTPPGNVFVTVSMTPIGQASSLAVRRFV